MRISMQYYRASENKWYWGLTAADGSNHATLYTDGRGHAQWAGSDYSSVHDWK